MAQTPNLDFSGQNLRGRNFKGQDLTGANFSYADIRGAKFTNATLERTNFSQAKAGLQRRWAIGLVIVSLLLSPLAAFTLAIISNLAAYFFFPQRINRYTIFGLTLVSCCLIVIFRLALNRYFGAFRDVVVSGALAVAIVVAVAGAGAGAVKARAGKEPMAVFVFVSLAGLMTLALADRLDELTAAIAGAVLGAFPGGYVAWQALARNENFIWVWEIAVAFATTGGTSFRGADLTDADFTEAILQRTDFREAIVTRTCWKKAKKLDQARVHGNILTDPVVRNLLVTKKGNGESFVKLNLKGANLTEADLIGAVLTESDLSGATLEGAHLEQVDRRSNLVRANLQGANLAGANLSYANLREADISEVNLQGACLEWVNLNKASAVGTNFTNAHLTGACLESWNIDSTTKLDQVDCRFVYLLENPKPGTDDRERRPCSGEFKPGEFTKLFQEILNTVDLIFRNGVDWKAFVTAFEKVQVENEVTKLAIQSIENKGDDVVVIRVSVPPEANKTKIHSEFRQNYEIALKAIEERHKVALKVKDDQIVLYRKQNSDLKEIVKLLANRPVNVEAKAISQNQSMSDSIDQSRKIEIVDADVTASTLNLGEISGSVTNTINALSDSNQPEQSGIKELLTKLQAAIEAETNLTPEGKADALEQVKALAEAEQKSQEGEKKNIGRRTLTFLRGTIAQLPTATKLVEECNKLLPLISKLLGLG